MLAAVACCSIYSNDISVGQ